MLLVDDEPDIRRIGQLSLTRVGKCEVVLAASGLEALELASTHRPDVILLDVMLPDMDGPTTLTRLRERPDLARVPIIFMTAKVQKPELERYLQLGALGVLSKPFDPVSLTREIFALLEARGA